MRIIFMGTPEFAVPSLKILIENQYNIVAVVTATDKKGGRGGNQNIISAVKKYAEKVNIPVLQPKNLKSPEFVSTLQSFHADLQVVVAFRMLPEVVWNMPPLGTINLHGSLLPKYRGAAPINWAIIKGEQETGVTTFKLKHEIDTGDIILQRSLPILESDNAGTVHDKLMFIGAELILDTVKMIEKDQVVYTIQDVDKATKAPKIFHSDCEIKFTEKGREIRNFIRGMSPYPGAYTYLDNVEVKIYDVDYEMLFHNVQPGKIMTDNKTYLKYFCQDGLISVNDLKMAGKKRMDIKTFLNGYTTLKLS